LDSAEIVLALLGKVSLCSKYILSCKEDMFQNKPLIKDLNTRVMTEITGMIHHILVQTSHPLL